MASTTTTRDFMAPQNVEDELIKENISYEESQRLYNQWSEEGTYDEMLVDPKVYNGLVVFGTGMEKLFTDKSAVKILDVGAGTGLSGEKLRSLGYTNVDGLEPCESFVKDCKRKGIYQNIIESAIGDKPLDVPDDTYDAVCTTGCFCPGHIPCSAIHEMVRIVKPGGYILNCMRESFIFEVPEYRDRLVPLLQSLEKEGKIKKVEWSRYPNHFSGKDGLRMIFQVL